MVDPDDLYNKEQDPYQTEWGGQYGSDTPGWYRSDNQPPAKESRTEGNGPVKTAARVAARRFLWKRRNLLIGGAGLGIGGLIVAALIFFSGPLQFIHFAQLLQQFHLTSNEDFGDGRAARTIMYAALGQANRSRLGVFTNIYVDKWENRMVRETGLRPLYSKDRFKNKFAAFEVVDELKARRFLSQFESEGINTRASPVDLVDRKGRPADPHARIADFSGEKRRFKKSVTRSVSLGTRTSNVVGYASARLLIKRGGLDYHPLRDLRIKAGETLKGFRNKVKNEQASRDRQGANQKPPAVAAESQTDKDGNQRTAPADQEAARRGNEVVDGAARADGDGPEGNRAIKGLGAALRTASGPAAFIGTLCAVKSFGDQVEDFQYLNDGIMMRLGGRIITTGNQIMSGQDVSLDELRILNEDFYDPETKTSWTQARSIQAELGQPLTGPDIPPEAKPDKDKPKIFRILDEVRGLGATCSGISKVFQAPIIRHVADWSSRAFIATIDLAIKGTGYSVEDIMNGAIKVAAGRAVDPYAKGAELGNIANYGARLMANDQALAMGGRAMTTAEAAALEARVAEAERFELDQRPIAKRLWDPYDRNSLIAKFIDNTPTSFAQFQSSLLSLPKNLMGAFPWAGNLNTVQAAQHYDYGFPEFGFSVAEQEDSRFEDPFENAAIIEPRLDELNEKYGDCFSMRVGPDGSLLNGESVSYQKLSNNENCRGVLDPQYQTEELLRYRFYLADVVTAHSLACYEGSEESCSQIGFTQTDSSDVAVSGPGGDFTIKKLNPPLPAPGGQITPKGITLHWWAGDSGDEGIDYLAGVLRSRGLSVQIGITKDGQVYQMTNNLNDYASHATGANNTTIGIEIEGRGDTQGPDADFGKDGIANYPKKFEAVVATVRYLVQKYNIPIEGKVQCHNVTGIHPHEAYNHCPGAVNKSDIDAYYFNEVIKRVRQ